MNVKNMAKWFLDVNLNEAETNMIERWFNDGNSIYRYNDVGTDKKTYLMVVYGILKAMTGHKVVIFYSDFDTHREIWNTGHKIYGKMKNYKKMAWMSITKFRFGGTCHFVDVNKPEDINGLRADTVIVADSEKIKYEDFKNLMIGIVNINSSPVKEGWSSLSLLVFDKEENSDILSCCSPDDGKYTGDGLFKDLWENPGKDIYGIKSVVTCCFDQERFKNGH